MENKKLNIQIILKKDNEGFLTTRNRKMWELDGSAYESIEELKEKQNVSFTLRNEVFIKNRGNTYCFEVKDISDLNLISPRNIEA